MAVPAPILFEIFETIMAGLVGGTVVKGFAEAARSLRAKQSAMRLVREKKDPRLVYLARIASKRALDINELKLARSRIRTIIEGLPADDASAIEGGLSQISKSGKRHYIQRLVAQASLADQSTKQDTSPPK